jgi:hypothetical protein
MWGSPIIWSGRIRLTRSNAKANGLVPYDYLMHVMNQITAGNTDPKKLLPWNVNLS